MRMQRVLLLALTLILAACGRSSPLATTFGFAPPVPTGESAPLPLTIPALREWQPASGTYRYSPGTRIVLGADDARLRADAQTFAADLQALSGTAPAVVRGGTVRPGDIELDLSAGDAQLGDEGYRLSTGPGIAISANTPAGAFYGTRTVLQLLHQNATIHAGIVRDWPHYPERGLAIDDGDDFYDSHWIEAQILDLAYLKLNTLHLHFSDNGGFRVESDTHPEIVAADHLSKQELSAVIALADRYHITVIPDLDMPGHMGGALAAHPELQLKNAAGQANADALDITNPAALKFARELMEEFLPLFPGPDWVIGGDEYLPAAEVPLNPELQSYAQAQYGTNANAKDALLGFFNWADGIVRAQGKTARVYNDELGGGSAVTVNPDLIVEWWTDVSPLSDLLPPTVQSLLDQGHTIVNISSDPTYYNGGTAGKIIPTSTPQAMYEHWEVNQFSGSVFLPPVDGYTPVRPPPQVISPDEPRNRGSKVFVWGGGEGEAGIAGDIYPRLRVMAQKTWNSPLLVQSYSNFQPIIDAVGHAPGFASQ